MDLTHFIPSFDELEAMLKDAPSSVEFDLQRCGFYLENQHLMMFYESKGMNDSGFFVRFNQLNPYVLYRGIVISDSANCESISLVVNPEFSRLRSSISFDRHGISYSCPDVRLAVQRKWFDDGAVMMQKAWEKYHLPVWIDALRKYSSEQIEVENLLN